MVTNKIIKIYKAFTAEHCTNMWAIKDGRFCDAPPETMMLITIM